jgi:hypothetical protein
MVSLNVPSQATPAYRFMKVDVDDNCDKAFYGDFSVSAYSASCVATCPDARVLDVIRCTNISLHGYVVGRSLKVPCSDSGKYVKRAARVRYNSSNRCLPLSINR